MKEGKYYHLKCSNYEGIGRSVCVAEHHIGILHEIIAYRGGTAISTYSWVSWALGKNDYREIEEKELSEAILNHLLNKEERQGHER